MWDKIIIIKNQCATDRVAVTVNVAVPKPSSGGLTVIFVCPLPPAETVSCMLVSVHVQPLLQAGPLADNVNVDEPHCDESWFVTITSKSHGLPASPL